MEISCKPFGGKEGAIGEGEEETGRQDLPGFSDQSYITNFFSAFIGLTLGVYREVFLEKEQKKKEKEGEKHGLEQ